MQEGRDCEEAVLAVSLGDYMVGIIINVRVRRVVGDKRRFMGWAIEVR